MDPCLPGSSCFPLFPVFSLCFPSFFFPRFFFSWFLFFVFHGFFFPGFPVFSPVFSPRVFPVFLLFPLVSLLFFLAQAFPCSFSRLWESLPAPPPGASRACYGIVQVPTGPWFCRKCESQERAARVRCELCPHKDGALKRTDNGGWAHVVCALYIPEVQFANVLTMEPIVLQYVPHDHCYICEEQGRESKAASGACMACNRHGCRQAFHVTCAQMAGLLCEEEVLEVDNVKYCGYCKYHFNKMVRARGMFGGGGGGGGGEEEEGWVVRMGGEGSSGCKSSPAFPPSLPLPAALPSSGNSDIPVLPGLFGFFPQSRKDKERPKQKHKKRPESPSSLPRPLWLRPLTRYRPMGWAGKSTPNGENGQKSLGTGKRGRKICLENREKGQENVTQSQPSLEVLGLETLSLIPVLFPAVPWDEPNPRELNPGVPSSRRCHKVTFLP
uniref:MLLT6, PHD finger containing n=1 Tax=Malurus cyaneus samueli TaxID=2593467 RepID=A0A8C5X0P3_9PASS